MVLKQLDVQTVILGINLAMEQVKSSGQQVSQIDFRTVVLVQPIQHPETLFKKVDFRPNIMDMHKMDTRMDIHIRTVIVSKMVMDNNQVMDNKMLTVSKEDMVDNKHQTLSLRVEASATPEHVPTLAIKDKDLIDKISLTVIKGKVYILYHRHL